MLIPYTNAAKALEAHGHDAITTKEGLIANTWVKVPETFGAEPGDEWLEETAVFDITPDNMVDTRPIRAWLGY